MSDAFPAFSGRHLTGLIISELSRPYSIFFIEHYNVKTESFYEVVLATNNYNSWIFMRLQMKKQNIDN